MNKIPYEERAKVYADALDSYGVNGQLTVALEEFTEVSKEICKALRDKYDAKAMAEEIADATIMLEQLRIIFGNNECVCNFMDSKIMRLKRELEEVNRDG